jgi:hypothetical protein
VSPWLPAVLHRSSLRGTALCTRCRARRPSSQRRRRITCQPPEGSGSGWEVPGGGTGRRSCGLRLQCRRRGARTECRCSPRRLGELVLVEVGIRVAECLDDHPHRPSCGRCRSLPRGEGDACAGWYRARGWIQGGLRAKDVGPVLRAVQHRLQSRCLYPSSRDSVTLETRSPCWPRDTEYRAGSRDLGSCGLGRSEATSGGLRGGRAAGVRSGGGRGQRSAG